MKIRFLEKLFAIPSFLFGGTPTNPVKFGGIGGEPGGVRMIHQALNPAEAEMIRQFLRSEGISVQFVPPVSTGIFGPVGSDCVHVLNEDAEAALALIDRYVHGDPSGGAEDPGAEQNEDTDDPERDA